MANVPTTGSAAFVYGTDGSGVLTDGSGRLLVAGGSGASAGQVQGTAAAGAAGVGNPVYIAGQDGTLIRGILVDTAGRQLIRLTNDGTNFMPSQDAVTRAGFQKMTDGTNVAGVNTATQQLVNTEGQKTTYSAMCQGANPGTSASNIVSLAGSGTKTVRILRVEISAIQTTGGVLDVLLGMHSSAFTGGTTSALTAVPHDRSSAAATAAAVRWSAPPTGGGALVGYVRAVKLWIPASTAQPAIQVWDFTTRNGQGLVLRGVADAFSVQLAGVTVTGGSFDASIEWTEE